MKSPRFDSARREGDSKIRILLADDHLLVREGIRASLRRHKHFTIVGEAADGWQAVQQARQLAPQVVLMDINMPGLSGLGATEVLRNELPGIKVLILTVHNNREYVLRIIQAGAQGYLLKDTSPDELVRAIEAVHRGDAFFSPEVARFVLNECVENRAARSTPPSLTPREREVLVRIAEGLTNKEIAKLLSVGVRTIETHRERIMQKLGIRTVAGLTKFAITNGIISLEN